MSRMLLERVGCKAVRSFNHIARNFSRLSIHRSPRQRSARLADDITFNDESNNTGICSVQTRADKNLQKKTTKISVKDLLKTAVSENIPPKDVNPEFLSDVTDYYSTRYKDYKEWVREQERLSAKSKISPKERSVILFPGQGSQFVGMGKNLLDYSNVRELYERASEILGYDLLDICLHGPQQKLNETIYCQPAVVATSLAAIEKLKEQNPWAVESCIATAGYSVGEYTALVFSGALSFEDAMRVIKVRAESMQKVSQTVPGRMMTVTLSPEAKIYFACRAARLYCDQELNMSGTVCEVSNYLYPGSKVIAGNAEALHFLEINAKEFGIRRVQYLPVSGAFHSTLMQPLKQTMVDALKSITINKPLISVHSNVNSLRYLSSESIRKLLVEQVYKPVMWEQTMHVIYSRPQGQLFPYTFEVGPGKQLGAMLLKVNKKGYDMYEAVSV